MGGNRNGRTWSATLAAALVLALVSLAIPAGAQISPWFMEHVSIGSGGGNGRFDAFFRGSSVDASHAFIETQESLVAGDTDSQFDLYDRSGGTATLLSAGQINGNGAFPVSYQGSSENGTRVFFETKESLVAADTDAAVDIYQRLAGVTSLLSAGQINGNGAFDATFAGASADGTRVFFESREQLTSGDTDTSKDVYERAAGVTTLVSIGSTAVCPAPFTSCPASFAGSSDDGLKLWFDTNARLTADDTDASLDIYERASATTTRVSAGQTNGNLAFDAFFAGASADGVRVFLHSREKLVAGDTDSSFDVYQRSSGATTWVSAGQINGNGAFDALLAGTSEDGTRVFFETNEALVGGDPDAQNDVYERFGATTTLLSIGPTSEAGVFVPSYRGASADGLTVFFETDETLTTQDTDGETDLYKRSGGATTLLSIGPHGGNGPKAAGFDGASVNGERVFFHTDESLISSDRDTFADVYEWAAGYVQLVSVGPVGGNGNFFADYVGSSADGSRVFLTTDERLMSSDTEVIGADVPIAAKPAGLTNSAGNVLVTTAAAAPHGLTTGDRVNLHGTTLAAYNDTWTVLSTPTASTYVISANFVSNEGGGAGKKLGYQDIYVTNEPAGYPRAKSSILYRASLVPAFGACTGGNRQHGPPLTGPSCNPSVHASNFLTMGTPDVAGNGAPTELIGSVRIKAVVGAPGPPDDSDVSVTTNVTDVRCKPATAATVCTQANVDPGQDYEGELEVSMLLRVTDRNNGPGLTESAVGQDTDVRVPVSCVDTPDTATGGVCSGTASLNAVLGTTVFKDGKRSNIQLGQIQVFDGGADGVASTSGNTAYLRQGVFVP